MDYPDGTFRVESFAGFHELCRWQFRHTGTLFRGVSNAERHLLIPGVGRYLETFRSRGMGKDELLKAERSAQFASWLVRRAWQSAAARYERLSGSRLFAILGISLLTVFISVATEGAGGLLSYVSTGMLGLSVLVLIWHLLPGWISLALGPLLLLWSTPLAIFGWELVVASPFLDVSVEAVPPGEYSVHHLPPAEEPPAPETEVQGPEGLLHSSSYEDPRALDLLTRWMLRHQPAFQKGGVFE